VTDGDSFNGLRGQLAEALRGEGGSLAGANKLCTVCVGLLGVDGAAISLVSGAIQATYGSSSPLSRRLDEYQFTFGEGPCMDAVTSGRPIAVADLHDRREQRWPAYSGAVLKAGIRAVFAIPVMLAGSHVGSLDLFRADPGALSDYEHAGALLAAELAALPLVDLAAEHAGYPPEEQEQDGWSRLAALQRVEVYQATGMVMAQLNLDTSEALARLRAHAFAQDLTASEVAWAIVERRLTLVADDAWGDDSNKREES